jgi:hypothetical protein
MSTIKLLRDMGLLERHTDDGVRYWVTGVDAGSFILAFVNWGSGTSADIIVCENGTHPLLGSNHITVVFTANKKQVITFMKAIGVKRFSEKIMKVIREQDK